MADLNVNALSEQAPAMAPPTRTDDQILPYSSWLPIEKSNCYLDVDRSQSNPIYKISVDILKHTNFFRAFIASSTIPSIYIHQFWDIGKKKANLIVISSVRFTKLIIHHLQSKHKFHPRPDSPPHLPYEESVLGYLKFSAKGTKREVFGMPIPNNLITADIQAQQYYNAYLEKVAKHQRYLAGKEVSDPDSPAPKPVKTTKPKAIKQSKPSAPRAAPESSKAPSPAKRPKAGKVIKKRTQKSSLQLVDEFVDKGVPVNEPREPESGKFQLLLEVQEKGKEKVGEEQAAQVLLNLQAPKKKSHAEYETESNDDVSPKINPEPQDEDQARPNPGKQVKGQAGSDPGDAADVQPQPSHVVHAGPNLEHMDFEATDASSPTKKKNPELMDKGHLQLPTPKKPASSTGTLSSLQNLDKELSFTNQFLAEKSLEDEPEKTNTKAEVQSMVTVPIHQDTSSVPLMSTLIIDLTVSQQAYTMVQAPLPSSTATVTAITTTTSLPPPPPQPQQALEERLDKHRTRLYNIENLNIPHKVKQAVDQVVTDAVDWAMQASLRDRFRDLLKADTKEILH
ncbi:hypothetical protein Tco_1247860 [Tanacetum coccineum]